MVPETRYARSGDVNIAYQVTGEGPIDLVFRAVMEVRVSGTVRDLVAGSGLAFQDLGPAALKGLPGEWQLLKITS